MASDEERDRPVRVEVATRVLVAMLTTPGENIKKVRAAVRYADMLLAEVDGVEMEELEEQG